VHRRLESLRRGARGQQLRPPARPRSPPRVPGDMGGGVAREPALPARRRLAARAHDGDWRAPAHARPRGGPTPARGRGRPGRAGDPRHAAEDAVVIFPIVLKTPAHVEPTAAISFLVAANGVFQVTRT